MTEARRFYLGAFGDPGHAFPMLALGRELVARGHFVVVETWVKWKLDVEATGATFVAAPEYQVFPTRERPLKPYEAAVRAAHETVGALRAHGPLDGVAHDVLTPAPALAGELEGIPVATLIPHLHPEMVPGDPLYSIGARRPRTRAGRAFWRTLHPMVRQALERGRDEYNDCRERLGLPPVPHVHSGLSRSLVLVSTLEELEYPREWAPWTHIVGPVMWEPPGERVEPVAGDAPVVLVAPSTSQDPSHALLRAAVAGLGTAPVRVIATWNGREPDPPIDVPANTVLVPWLSYSQTMPLCDVVVCHGGHGTLMRALTNGCPVVVCPAGGDMAENAARCDWAGVGVRFPRRLLSPSTVRLAVDRALDGDRRAARAREIAAGAPDGAARAADLLEEWAARRGPPAAVADQSGAGAAHRLGR